MTWFVWDIRLCRHQHMNITVNIPRPLRDCCDGQAEIELPVDSVREALEQIEKRYPELHRCVCDETGAVRRHVNVFVNVPDDGGLDAPLAAGDTITVFQAVSGG